MNIAINDKAEAQTYIEFEQVYLSELVMQLTHTRDEFAKQSLVQHATAHIAGYTTADAVGGTTPVVGTHPANVASMNGSNILNMGDIEEIILNFRSNTVDRRDTNVVNGDYATYLTSSTKLRAPLKGFGGTYPIIIGPAGVQQLEEDEKFAAYMVYGISDKVGSRNSYNNGSEIKFNDKVFIVTDNVARYYSTEEVVG